MNQSPQTPIDNGAIDWVIALTNTYGWLLTTVIIILVAIIYIFQRVVQHATEKAIENAFARQMKMFELAAEDAFARQMKMFELAAGRRSAFVQQVQADRWGAVNDFIIRIERIFTNINRFRHGHTVDGLISTSEGGQIDIVPLTAVIEDLHGKQLLLGQDFYRLLWKRAEIAIKFAQIKAPPEASDRVQSIMEAKQANMREIEVALEGVFRLSSIDNNE